MNKGNLILIILTVLLSFILISVLGSTDFRTTINEDNSSNIPRCPSGSVSDSDMYMEMLEKNDKEINDPPIDSVPSFRVRTNSYGLRDEEFQLQKPRNQTRILVVGDSITYGYGVNESNRFTEILENKLSTNIEEKVRVINAGRPGAGMKDYYEFVVNKADKYDSDLVIVAFDEEDAFDRELQDGFIKEQKENRGISENTSIHSKEKAEDAVDSQLKDYQENLQWYDSNYRKYMAKLLELDEYNDYDLFLYRLSTTDEAEIATKPVEDTKFKTVYEYWREKCDEDLIQPPENITKAPKFTFYPDPHFNKAGNRILGEWLYEQLKTYPEYSKISTGNLE